MRGSKKKRAHPRGGHRLANGLLPLFFLLLLLCLILPTTPRPSSGRLRRALKPGNDTSNISNSGGSVEATPAAKHVERSCKPVRIPATFLPIANDVECAATVVAAIPGEVVGQPLAPSAELKALGTNIHGALLSLHRDSKCGDWDRRNMNVWDTQFGNQFYEWVETYAEHALCGNLEQKHHKIFNLDYCRATIAGTEHSDACTEFVRARNVRKSGKLECTWGAFGYGPVMPLVRAEWAQAAHEVLSSAQLEHEQPCSYVQGLPPGVPYVAVHLRCGDVVNGGFERKGHIHIKHTWLERFMPYVARDVDYIVVLGNRGVHSSDDSHESKRIAQVCTVLFGELRVKLASMTGKTVLIAPELRMNRVNLVRDTRCMSQSHSLISLSLKSSFTHWQLMLHNGCSTYQPYVVDVEKFADILPPNYHHNHKERPNQRFIELFSNDTEIWGKAASAVTARYSALGN